MKADQTIDYHIKSVWHAISRMYNNLASELDGTMAIGYVLLNIDKEGTPATKIGPLLGLETRSLTRTLKTLEEKNLIYKKIDQKDRRVVKIFLTEEGVEKRNLSRERVILFNDLVKKELGEDKITTFLSIIKEIGKIVEIKTESEKKELSPKIP